MDFGSVFKLQEPLHRAWSGNREQRQNRKGEMVWENRPIESINETDVRALIGIPEGRDLEYKQELYGDSGDSKREFLKDISSLANTVGGHVIIGMVATDGIATNLRGVEVSGVVGLRGQVRHVNSRSISSYVLTGCIGYLVGLRRLDIAPPLAIFVTLVGVRGASLDIRDTDDHDPPTFDRDVVHCREVILTEYPRDDGEFPQIMQLVLDELANAAGRRSWSLR